MEHHRLAEIDSRTAAAEAAEAAGQDPIAEELIRIVDIRGPGQRQGLARLSRHLHPDAIPAIAPMAGMSSGRPTLHVP